MAMSAQQRALHTETLRLLREDCIDEALRSAEEGCRIDPEDDEAARLLAVCYLAQRRFQAALEVFVRFHGRGQDEACLPTGSSMV